MRTKIVLLAGLLLLSSQSWGATEWIHLGKFVRCNKINQCIELSSQEMQRASVFPIIAFGKGTLKIYNTRPGVGATLTHTLTAREGYIDLLSNRIILRQPTDNQKLSEIIYFIESGKTLKL